MERPDNTKSPHQKVGYEEDSLQEGKTCSRCKHFINAKPPRCETVANPIAARGWCQRFELDPDKLPFQEYREYRENGEGRKKLHDPETAAYRESRESEGES